MFRRAQQELDLEPRRRITQEDKARIIAEKARREKQQSKLNERERTETGLRERQSFEDAERRRRLDESNMNAEQVRQKQIEKARNSQKQLNSGEDVSRAPKRSLKNTESVRSSVSQKKKMRENQDI